ncbi:MAG: Bd3614 family nucleic acid deaminase [Longimicrobiaceae bacterium]
MRSRQEVGMAVAYAIADLAGREVALGAKVTANFPEPLSWAYDTSATAHDTRTAAVNLLQGSSEGGPKTGSELYLTYVPTAACIGMAAMLGIKALYFVQGGGIHKLSLAGGAPALAAATPVNLNPGGAERIHPPIPDVGDGGGGGGWLAAGPVNRRRLAGAWVDALPGAPAPNARLLAGHVDRVATVTGVNHDPDFTMSVPTQAVGGVRAVFRNRLFMALARVLVSRNWQPQAPSALNLDLRQALPRSPVAPGKNIAAVLVSATNQIIGWGVNTNDARSTRHAETNAIQAFQREAGTAIPAGATLYSTLEPCYMCAGLFVHAGGTSCVYEQTDPDMVGNTALYTTPGANLQKHVEAYSGAVDVVDRVPVPRAPTVRTMGQALDDGLVRFRQQVGLGQRATAADYLRSGNPAYEVYSRAHERLVVTGMGAQNFAERTLWQEVLDFLRRGHAGEVGLQPHLMMID